MWEVISEDPSGKKESQMGKGGSDEGFVLVLVTSVSNSDLILLEHAGTSEPPHRGDKCAGYLLHLLLPVVDGRNGKGDVSSIPCHAGAKKDLGAKESPQTRKRRGWQQEIRQVCAKGARIRADL